MGPIGCPEFINIIVSIRLLFSCREPLRNRRQAYCRFQKAIGDERAFLALNWPENDKSYCLRLIQFESDLARYA